MWRGYLEHKRENSIKTIYFDAFENDYQKDPFLAIGSEIYSLLEDKDEKKKKEFTEKATGAAKSLMRGAIKIGVKVATAGIVDGSAVDSAEKEISNLISGQVDEIIADKFKNVKTDKLALQNFKIYLEQFANDVNNKKPIVFIIDELDRCRPDFALELLEQVKHLFSVKGITFLLVTNRKQLEQSIRSRYGSDDPTNYLHKFINLWVSLPRKSDEYYDSGVEFLKYSISKMKSETEEIKNDSCIKIFNDLIMHYQISYREIERMLSYFAILHNMSGDTKYYENYQYMMAFVCFIKATKPSLLKLINKDMSCEEILKSTGLINIKEEHKFYSLNYMKNLIIYEFSDESKKNAMIKDEIIYQGRPLRGNF